MNNYVFVAGVNGSGKSTLIENIQNSPEFQGYTYICADDIEKLIPKTVSNLNNRMLLARQMALETRENLLNHHKDIIFESVASHPSHLEDLDEIKKRGYNIFTIYVTTKDPSVNIERIKNRGRDNDKYLLEGDRVKNRYYRSLDLLFDMIKKSDTVFAFDNSGTYLGVFFKQEDAWCALKNSIWLKEYILDKASKENIEIIEKARANYNLRIRIEALETILTGKNCFTDKTPYIHKPDKNKGNNNDRSK